MKKRIIISVTFIVVAVINVDAQNKNATATSPVTATENVVIALPPPPPIPPTPPVPPAEAENEIPPAPPAPPIPPIVFAEPERPEIINSNGYEISVRAINGRSIVVLKKDGKTQKIKLSTWNANRKYYEKKYGLLPPPPPSLPVIEEIEFTPPVIKKDD